MIKGSTYQEGVTERYTHQTTEAQNIWGNIDNQREKLIVLQ